MSNCWDRDGFRKIEMEDAFGAYKPGTAVSHYSQEYVDELRAVAKMAIDDKHKELMDLKLKHDLMLEEKNSQIAEMEHKYRCEHGTNKRLRQELESAHHSISSLNYHIELMEQKVDRLEEEVAGGRSVDYRRQWKVAEEKIQKLGTYIEQLETRVKDREDQIDYHQNEIDEYVEKLDTAIQDKEYYMREIKDYQKRIKDMQNINLARSIDINRAMDILKKI